MITYIYLITLCQAFFQTVILVVHQAINKKKITSAIFNIALTIYSSI